MKKFRSDEHFPLLLFLVENDRKQRKNGGLCFEKSRFGGITNGASAIITEWPNYLNSCWMTAIICGLTLFILTMMLSISMSSFYVQRRIPKCITITDNNQSNEIRKNNNNQTIIHLVHGPNNWTQTELEMLEEISKIFNSYQINLVILINNPETFRKTIEITKQTTKNTNLTTMNTNQATKNTNQTTNHYNMTSSNTNSNRNIYKQTDFDFDKNQSNSSFHDNLQKLLMVLFRINGTNQSSPGSSTGTTTVAELTESKTKIKNLKDLLKTYANIKVSHFDYFDLLNQFPITYHQWSLMDDFLKIFTIRIWALWQNGGLSFDLQLNKEFNGISSIEAFLQRMWKRFQNLPTDAVLIDRKAKYLASKVACHVFFGEILFQLQSANDERTTVEEVVGNALKVFCRNDRFSKSFCKYIV